MDTHIQNILHGNEFSVDLIKFQQNMITMASAHFEVIIHPLLQLIFFIVMEIHIETNK